VEEVYDNGVEKVWQTPP